MHNLLERVLKFSQENKASKNFLDFIEIFYSDSEAEDFESYSNEDLYKSALFSFEFFSSKKRGELKIRAWNPAKEKEGFASDFTYVDIISDDMPFIVDSTVLNLDKGGIRIKNIIYPIFLVSRDKDNKLQKLSSVNFGKDELQESVTQLHIDKITSNEELIAIEEKIRKILETLSLIVSDWELMLKMIKDAQSQIDNAKKIGKSDKEIAEIKEFISWISAGNFVFLGAKEFDIRQVEKGEYRLEEVKNSGLGIFRSPYEDMRPEVLNCSHAEVSGSVTNPYAIEIVKSRYRSRIHRISNAERIRIQKISANGEVVGEYRVAGLFTTSSYHDSINKIPLLRDKVAKVIADSKYIKGSHNYKELISTLQSYPRDELFQIDAEDLLKKASGIVAICGRSQVKFFARKDKFDRFVSCLIFSPRDRSNSDLREKIKEYLAKVFNGEIADSFIQISDSNLMRLHVIVRTNKGIPSFDEAQIESEIAKMTRIWSDELRFAIQAKYDEEKRIALFAKYKNSFSVSYTNRFDPRRAAIDIEKIEKCLDEDGVVFNLYKSSESLPEDVSELKIYSPRKEIILSEIMPILESFGFSVIQEHTYAVSIEQDIKVRTQTKVWVHYFHLNLSRHGHKFNERIRKNFERAIVSIWSGETQVDFFNRLVIAADLSWKQVYVLRAYLKYLHQAGFRYNQQYVADVLVRYPQLVRLLIELFQSKFNPSLEEDFAKRKVLIEKISAAIEDALKQVKDALDDVVIRRIYAVISATLRTNYYQVVDGHNFKGYISLKFDCKKIPELPLPLPYAEIFVYSARVEALHLRGGKVARGGLRWSDRHEDFRTEILGLVKAQMTKNAVIVPVGSKGGFVVKKNTLGMTRDEIQKEGIECYKIFLRGLLDVTDNVVNGKIQHPANVVMHDAADPYLVVAADKGTATFSDIANSVSAEYNFWLGDAFASGGSVGYDHKKMGITAKGGWISVMRHFREMGRDTQTQDFTCVGIGDLAGDVFGNGMLLSRHIRLVAAFNHMHIFFDPDPVAATSFEERQRMFNLPRSSWLDYDKSLISKGGGIFERSAKSITLSPEMKEVLAVEEDEMTPNELIRAILRAPVDLLWNGGIGTYVKAADETDLDVGDRANDVLRINGGELRCRVVGEGGNLGFTQKGRIEYVLTGGRANTDAMDNSAGVDCSDHEVNIKIALTAAMRSGKLTLDERNKVLESMTNEVSHLVLEDNRLQTQAISIAFSQGHNALGDQGQFLYRLEKSGLLNRKIEFLPSKKEIEKRQVDRVGLTRPELCVMLAYAKMDIYNHLLVSDLVKDKYFESELTSYFPSVMQEKFAEEISTHQLRNEIIATQITNFVVNRIGITFISQICQDSGFSLVEVVKNFIIACDSFRIREVWEEIEKLDGKVSSEIQMQMFLSANKLLERSVLWLLRNQTKSDVTATVMRFRKITDELSSVLARVLAKASRESFERKIERYCLNNVDRKLASRIAALDPIASAFDIAEISESSKLDIETISKVYFEVGTRFSLKWLRSRLSKSTIDNYWQKLSAKTIMEDIYSYQMRIAKAVVDSSNEDKKLCKTDALTAWIEKMDFLVERFDNFIDDLKTQSNPDLSVFVVALNRLKPLVK
jgi:glutamate dehydrogenase